ncbi:MAG: TonB-dependent receptor [Dysgonamonadaceae bacterium]|nr:TonB-dependent receptor [Dysgonamonadaceae bacterium]
MINHFLYGIKVKAFASITLFFISFNIYGYNLSGSIINSNTLQPVEGAIVNLLTSDSSLVNNVLSKADGSFVIKQVQSGNYFLEITHVGLETKTVQISNLSENIDLGKIEMFEKTLELEEVSVTANSNLTKIDRQIIFPTATQLNTSFSGLDVLSKIMLPRLIVNTTMNTIRSLSPKGVQIRINDVKSTTEDLLSIQPKDIVRIEYIDMPGVRYGEVSEVINIITRRRERGGVVGTNLIQALTTNYSNDYVYAKINHKESEFGIAYNFIYNNHADTYSTNNQSFLLKDGTEYNIRKVGVKSPSESMQHNMAFTYNWTRENKTIFNLLLRNRYYFPESSAVQHIFEGENLSGSLSNFKSTTKSHTPSLDLYLFHQLDNRQSITVNTVGTLINTDYRRNYREYVYPDEVLDSHYEYTVDGKKYSSISEAIYEYKIKNNLIFSSGIQHTQGYTKNVYTNQDDSETVNDMHNSETYLYSQIQGKVNKFGYQFGAGLSRQYFKEGAAKYTFYTFRPSLSLSYFFTDRLSLRYQFYITPLLPSLSNLSDVRQQQNKYEVWEGNPHLKPYRAYANNLTYGLNFKRINVQLSGYYQLSKNPIMSVSVRRIDEEDAFYFVYGIENQKSYQHLQTRLFTRIEVIKDRLYLSAWSGVNRYINQGNEYVHTYTGYFGGIQLEGNYKNWILSANLDSDLKYLFAETLYCNSKSANVGIKYKHKDLQAGIAVMNPFLPNGSPSGSNYLSSTVKKEDRSYSRDYGNMVTLSLSWDFSFGRKYKIDPKKINKSDEDSGIVR